MISSWKQPPRPVMRTISWTFFDAPVCAMPVSVHKIITLPRTLLLQCTYNYIIIFQPQRWKSSANTKLFLLFSFVYLCFGLFSLYLFFHLPYSCSLLAKVLLVFGSTWMFNAELLIWLITCMAFACMVYLLRSLPSFGILCLVFFFFVFCFENSVQSIFHLKKKTRNV